MASVSVDARDVINGSSAEVPDAKVLKMIKRAEVKTDPRSCIPTTVRLTDAPSMRKNLAQKSGTGSPDPLGSLVLDTFQVQCQIGG